MSRIPVRLILALLFAAAVAATVVTFQKKLPKTQRYPIAQVDAPLADAPERRTIDAPAGVARNAILIIGDGMGTSIIEAARLTSTGENGLLEMQKLPARAMVTTRSANDIVTDSAAAATAIATGVKTNNRMVSIDPAGNRLRTILEAAETAGILTGLVTTTDASDATPAAFGAHVASRYEERPEIASQLVAADIEILMGSDVKHFAPLSAGGRRSDGRNLLTEASSSGTTVVRDLPGLRATRSMPLIGIFEENDRPPLPDLALESLRLLQASGERFFLMIESEATDSAAHDKDLGRTLSAVRELDQAVTVAMEFARRDGSTIVIVTADHDTGGLTIVPSDSPKLLQVVWPTSAHTAEDVALYAFGPGTEAFAGSLDNTDITPILARLLGIEAELAAK